MWVEHTTLVAHQQPCGHPSRVLATHKDRALHGETLCELGHMAALGKFVFSRSCPKKLQGAVNMLAQVKDVLFLYKLF